MTKQNIRILMISLGLLLLSTNISAKRYSYPERMDKPEYKALFTEVRKYVEEGKYKEAIAEHKKIMENRPNDVLIRINHYVGAGRIHRLRLKDYKEAIQAYQEGIKSIPRDDEKYARLWIEAQRGMAKCYKKLGEYDKAIEVSQRLITKYPDSDLAGTTPGIIYSSFKEKGEVYKGVRVLEKLAKKYPDTIVERTALINLADYYEEHKDYKKSTEKWQEAGEKFPDAKLTPYAQAKIKIMEEREGLKLKEKPALGKKISRQQLVRLIGIPLVALVALIYLSILIVRWRKKKK